MLSRESHLVELVDDDGNGTGSCTVADAHTAPGVLHRAFSVLLVDDQGRLLVQQRAVSKTRFPLRWANACCGHPAPGETVVEAASKRLGEELGIHEAVLKPVGVYTYRAEDPQTGRVEHEYDHVLLGRVTSGGWLQLDPVEVAGVRWVAPSWLHADLAASPDQYAPWLAGVLEVAMAAAPDLRPGSGSAQTGQAAQAATEPSGDR